MLVSIQTRTSFHVGGILSTGDLERLRIQALYALETMLSSEPEE